MHEKPIVSENNPVVIRDDDNDDEEEEEEEIEEVEVESGFISQLSCSENSIHQSLRGLAPSWKMQVKQRGSARHFEYSVTCSHCVVLNVKCTGIVCISDEFRVSESEPTREELKILHKTLKKVEGDIETFSFNTTIPAFMICTNELTALKCDKRAVLEPLVIAIAPYAPHIAEELWHRLGHTDSVTTATFPAWEEKYLVEDSFEYPVSFNGKVRFKLPMPVDASNADIETAVKTAPEAAKWLEGKTIRKVIIVPKKIVNVVVG